VVLMSVMELSRSHERTLIVLEDVEHRFRLKFCTDPHEAERLAREMGRARCSCNPVYDFVHALLRALRATITHVVLDDAGLRSIRAVVCLEREGLEIALPCYPPDALALALRARVPIYATAGALAHAEPLSPDDAPPSAPADLREWLERVKPEDF